MLKNNEIKQAAFILDQAQIFTGTVVVGDEIVVYDYNGSGQTATFDWEGKRHADRRTLAYWVGRSPSHRTWQEF